jgi:alkaline phosphatase D
MDHSFVFKAERPWPNKRFKKGTIVGHTTHNSCRLWVRTGAKGDFALLYYTKPADGQKDSNFPKLKSVPFSLSSLPNPVKKHPFIISDYSNDTTYVADLDNLQPETTYCYAVYQKSTQTLEKRILVGQDRPHSFKTLPANPAEIAFATYSCHKPFVRLFSFNSIVNLDMWDLLHKTLKKQEDLAFVIGTGDQVYTDGLKSLNIWEYLNTYMDKKPDGTLVPSEAEMLSWYRDIYRGYWGFNQVRQVYSNFPNYMMWDDHELGDGWGSRYLKRDNKNELKKILPKLKDKPNLTKQDGLALVGRMESAGKKAFDEYQHSHNPKPEPGATADQRDFGFYVGDHAAYYFLDGRGHRDIERDSHRILGKDQLDRFLDWLKSPATQSRKFLFVVAGVPFVHLRSGLTAKEKSKILKKFGAEDDMRDHWENKIHDQERKAVLEALFDLSETSGVKVCILSGDVHIASGFKIQNNNGTTLYQLTSSSISNDSTRSLGVIMGTLVPRKGKTRDGYSFKRIALYTGLNFSMVKTMGDEILFELYALQWLEDEDALGYDKTMVEVPLIEQTLSF